MPDAVNRVFEITELRERILLGLNEKDILRVKGVSKEWKATIETSPNLRKALFLMVETKARAHEYKPGSFVPVTYLNPLFLPTGRASFYSPLLPFSQTRIGVREYLGRKRVPANASCRNMLLTQPPVNRLVVRIKYCYSTQMDSMTEDERGFSSVASVGWYHKNMDVENDEGTKIGDVLKALEGMGIDGTVDMRVIAAFAPHIAPVMQTAEHSSVGSESVVKASVSNEKLLKLELQLDVKQPRHYEMKTGWGSICRPIEKFDPDSDGTVIKRYAKPG